jgi:HK97 gp10 family phage protein
MNIQFKQGGEWVDANASIAEIRLIGLEALQQKLTQFEPKVARKYLRQGLREGAKIFQRVAKANAPRQTGALRRAIKVRAGKRNTVRVSIGSQWFQGDQFYAAFLEFGWKQGNRNLKDKRKKVAGKHYMKKSYDIAKDQASEAARESLKRLIEQAAGETI